MHSNSTRYGTFLTQGGWKQLFQNYYDSILEILEFITTDEELRDERNNDWKKIMSRMLPRMADVIDNFDRFYLLCKIPPAVPDDIKEVYHNCKFTKYKLPKEYCINVKKIQK